MSEALVSKNEVDVQRLLAGGVKIIKIFIK